MLPHRKGHTLPRAMGWCSRDKKNWLLSILIISLWQFTAILLLLVVVLSLRAFALHSKVITFFQ